MNDPVWRDPEADFVADAGVVADVGRVDVEAGELALQRRDSRVDPRAWILGAHLRKDFGARDFPSRLDRCQRPAPEGEVDRKRLNYQIADCDLRDAASLGIPSGDGHVQTGDEVAGDEIAAVRPAVLLMSLNRMKA